jgi:hypothetical protein
MAAVAAMQTGARTPANKNFLTDFIELLRTSHSADAGLARVCLVDGRWREQ